MYGYLFETVNCFKVGVKKVGGGSVTDSFLVKGVAFKKTFSYAGFEQQPKSFDNPGVLLLNVELELKSEKVWGTTILVCDVAPPHIIGEVE